MDTLIKKITLHAKLKIKNVEYMVKTKTWYSIEEDKSVLYIKCELTDNKVLVIIPDDNLIYIGEIIPNMKYDRLNKDKIKYNNKIYYKTGEGHQYIKNIEFGDVSEIEGKCNFEDFECEGNIISLGILTEKNNERADVLAEILKIEDTKNLTIM